MKAVGEEFTMNGKKYRMLGVEPDGRIKLACLFCGGKIVYKDASQIPN